MSVEMWKIFFDSGAVILLFLTFAFGAGSLITGNIINERQSKQLKQFDKGITDARIELGKQQERAANADARVAGLEADAANAKSELAKQQTIAANAEKALLELQQRLAHRRISKSDQNEMVALLYPFRGSAIRLTKLGDSEAMQFADDLLAVLHAAQWSVQLSTIGTLSPPRYGLACAVDESSLAGKALAKALSGLPTANITPVTLNGSVADIMVGLKPPA